MNRKQIIALGLAGLALAGVAGAAHGQATPSDYTSATRYDLMGRVTGTIAPDPDGGGPLAFAAVRNTYDDAGRLVKIETGELTGWQSEEVEPRLWSGFDVHTIVERTYNIQNAKLTEKVRGKDGATVTTVSLIQYSYDGAGRLECTAVRMNRAAYGALPESACALGEQGNQGPDRITKNFYDPTSQLIQVKKAVGTSLEQAYVTYSYTDNGKIEYTVDANGNRAKFEYDGHDRQVKWLFPSETLPTAYDPSSVANAFATAGAFNANDFEAYAYDANGNRTSLTKRDGSVISYQYDRLNRMTFKTAVPGSGAADIPDVQYDYDLRGLQTSAVFGDGKGVFSYWDGFGRQERAKVDLDGNVRELTYGYDKNGNRTSIRHETGTAVQFNYGYDGLNRLKRLQRASIDLLTVSYNARGPVSGVDRIQNALDQSYGYDSAGRLSSMAFAAGSDSANVSWAFTRNQASQLLTEDRTNPDYAWGGQANAAVAYVTNGLNQYSKVDGTTLCYDANGNLTRDATYAYRYDVENRLVEMRLKAGGSCPTAIAGYTGYLRAQLRYDPLGRLHEVIKYVGADVPSSTRRFQYDGDAMVAEFDGGTTIVNRYLHGSDAGADDPLIWYPGSYVGEANARHLYADPRGSIVLVKTSAGSTIAINSYDEWGAPEDDNQGRFQYTGQVWLDETGMYYYKARMYSPSLGRFLQADPIGYDDNVNLYAYVANDPANTIDPKGDQAVAIGGRLAAAGVAAASDGPLPIGDVVAVGILLYTGYEILSAETSEEQATESSKPSAPRPSDGTPAREGAAPVRVGQKGADDIYTKPGGADQANEDFDASADPDSVVDRGDGVRTGTTPAGDNITVRPSSAKGQGPATVEVTRGNGRTRQTDKVRYPDRKPS